MKPGGIPGKSGSVKTLADSRFLVITAVFVLLIFAGGTMAFFQLRRIIQNSADQRLFQLLEVERLKLETSVNNEISIAIKMADSPIIRRYFADPGGANLKAYAIEEIAAYRRAFKNNYVFWVSDMDKKFYSPDNELFFESPGGGDPVYVIDPDNPEDYWYNMTLLETELYNFNINYNDNLKVTNLWINAPVFDDKKQAIGVLGTGIDLTGFVNDIYSELDPGVQLFLFNEFEEITGARDPSLAHEKADISTQFENNATEVIAAARSLSEQGVFSITTGEREIAVGRIPQLNWYMAAYIPITAGLYLRNPMTYVLFSMLIVILLVFFMLYRRGQEGKRLEEQVQQRTRLIAAMKDNLKAGLFLLDANFVIQGSYSKPLEQILGTGEIEGKKFTGFLGTSIMAKERDTLEDYFNMVIKRAYDSKMLDEINPIAEFVYADEINREEKTLRSSFAPVDQDGENLILGTLEDVTEARKLEKLLSEEENKREEEMRAFFQVIQVEPRVFGDFIEDTEYEFDRINTTLKNKEITAKEAITDIYQSVHAIKSNAIILGLENFSGKLHDLEDTIKKYRDQFEVTFEDVLHITVRLESIMKEKDKFRDTIGKIEAFRVKTGNRRQDRHVLVETLTRACEKAAAALDKKVGFVVDDIDGVVLESGPRRVIKEVLTQLVRNSVYHGIENPGEREAAGKDREGVVRLSIKQEAGMIHLKLSDDGKGLNFAKIREKALDLKLLSNEQEANDKNHLLKVIFSPGFSTAETADMHAGRGIGLNLVRERVRDLHGSIKISSEAGKGTTFNIFIPQEARAVEKAS
jgi:two-component system chemotaxis sensor kinase CheA